MPTRILIIDDEQPIRFALRGILEDEGHTVLEAGSAEDGLLLVAQDQPDLIFLDIWLPSMDGLTALERLGAEYPSLPVVMISGHGTIETAVSAIRLGAYDFIEKPLSLEKVLLVTTRALEMGELRRKNRALHTSLPTQDELVGASPVMKGFLEQFEKVAPTNVWVLLTGENGTGKELAARALHAKSGRSHEPFIAVNCAAIPEELIESELFGHEKGAFTGADASRVGRFEMAHKGTLFLDEIGDMSLRTQAKILRILQEQTFERVGSTRSITVDVRVIAATNKNLEDAIAQGQFREDLYYRLRVMPLHLPPLRERGQDLLLLLETFLYHLSKQHGCKAPQFDKNALALLEQYEWPGNVRELRNFVERVVILHAGKTITKRDLPTEMRPECHENLCKTPLKLEQHNQDNTLESKNFFDQLLNEQDFKKARAAFEASYLTHNLEACGGNVTRLAETVGLERSYLHRKLKNFGINH